MNFSKSKIIQSVRCSVTIVATPKIKTVLKATNW